MFGIINVIDGYLTNTDGSIMSFVSEEAASDFFVMNNISNPESYGLFINKIV